MVTITAPDPGLSGRVVGLDFVDGVAEIKGDLNRPQALWFATHGFTVTGDEVEPQPWEAPDESWTNARIEEYAARHGIDLAGATVKADMLAAVRDPGTEKTAGPGQPPPPVG